jgi:hypothetical protein
MNMNECNNNKSINNSDIKLFKKKNTDILITRITERSGNDGEKRQRTVSIDFFLYPHN